jgi:hypothetical protein
MLKLQMKSVIGDGLDVSYLIRVDDSDAEMPDILIISSTSLLTKIEKLLSI